MTELLKNGYTKIANELLENIAKIKLSPTQHSLLYIIWRYTYGFQREEHYLSISFLSKATDCDHRNVQREIKKLVKRKIILQSVVGQKRKLSLNKNYREWDGYSTNGRIDNGNIDKCQNNQITHGEITIEANGQTTTQEIKNEKLKENKYNDIFDFYMTLNLIKHRYYKPEMANAMKKAMKELNCDTEHLKTLLKRHSERVQATKNNKYPVKPRGITDFFGMKKYGSTQLICSEYDSEYNESNDFKNNNQKPQDPYRNLEIYK